MDPASSEFEEQRAGDRHELSLRRVTESIRRNPLAALGVSALTGFVFGGGARTRLGGAALLLTARVALREAVSGTVTNALRAQDGASDSRD